MARVRRKRSSNDDLVEAAEGQLHHILRVDNLSDAGAVSFHHGCRSFYLDRLTDGADPQHRIDGRGGSHLQYDAVLNIRSETVLLDFHTVWTDGQAGQ